MRKEIEYWDLYDLQLRRTGKTALRGTGLPEGTLHLVVHICIFDSAGRLLIQQRQTFKEGWPNLWDLTVGGSALAGETSQQAAQRELFEEIGYRADFEKMRPFFTVHFPRGFDDVYFIQDDVDLACLTLQQEEVQRVKWAAEDEVLDMIDRGLFIPYYPSLIKLLFEMRQSRGALKGK